MNSLLNSFEKEVKVRGIKAFLDFIVASILLKENCGGYEILAKIHENLGVLLSPGVLYPTLHEMEKKGLVRVEKVGRKKIFSITDKGVNWHEEMLKASTKIFDVVAFFVLQEKKPHEKIIVTLDSIE